MRKKIERILGFLIIVLAVLFTVFYLFAAIMGQAILTKELENFTHKEVTIGYFSLTPSLKLEIRDLEISGLVKLKSIYLSPSIVGLLRGKLVLNQLTFFQPEIFLSKVPKEVTDAIVSTEAILPLAENAPKAKKSGFLPFGIKQFSIKGGELIFIDQTVSTGSIKITIKEINSVVKNIYFFPSNKVIEFKVTAVIPWRDKEDQGRMELEGWINSFKKDIRATLNIKDIDAVYLYPYYSYWVDLDKARIEVFEHLIEALGRIA